MANVSRRQFCKRALVGSAVALGFGRVASATPNWIDERQVGPFICRSAFPLAGRETLLEELAPLERELQRVLAVRPCKSPVHLYLMANERQHNAYIAERFPEVPYRRALFIKQNDQASVFAYLNDELDVDVRHECTHALLHADLPMVPLWLDEGLAEYFEVAKPMRARQNPHLRKLKWDLRRRRMLTIRELEHKRQLEEMSAMDYRFAWAWTHYMLHGPVAAHAALVTFLHDIRNHTAPGSLSARLTEAVPSAVDRFQEHFRNL